jgi:FAD/FMN-containing dehydrogenase
MNKVSSFGSYPKYPQTPHIVNWHDELSQEITNLDCGFLPFGNGRSYGDSCLAASDQVLQIHNNRFIEANWDSGIIKAEAGITFGELLEVIIPNGYFLPVTPGTKYITLGGAVANDVHGKNHHVRGTFGCHILSFGLMRSDLEEIICSPSQNIELFNATIGGLGLTGVITFVEFKLLPIKSSNISTKTISFRSLDKFFLLNEELEKNHEYLVAWIDCLNFGRGALIAGNHYDDEMLEVSKKKKITMPITPPISLINKFTLSAFNNIYYKSQQLKSGKNITNYEPFFYPLDGILEWNRIYGRKGFQQYQCVIPNANARDGIKEILKIIAKFKQGSFLAVLKKCGDIKSPGLLSFPLPGLSLAMDFVQSDLLNDKLFVALDDVLREAGGRLYPAKDAHMLGSDFRKFYPVWEQLEALRDKKINSRFWERVTKL